MSNFLPTLYQEFIYKSRYARWLDSEKRRENWSETVCRYFDYMEGHLKKNHDYVIPKSMREELEQAVLALEVMPSMRALMTAGPALDKDNTGAYNCSYVVVDDPKAFDEAMVILMAGTGVGFSVERQYVQKLPEIPERLFNSETVIVVRDSKEGWGKALRQLIALLYSGEIPKWDVSQLRPAGAILKTFGGRSSGPEPLVDLFRFTVKTFRNAVGRKLNSLECHDIMCKIGEVVVVGGVRRSAMISLSNLSDDRMRSAKSGSWWETEPQRALANNSAAYTEKPEIGVFMREWTSLYESKSGERGIFSRTAAEQQVKKFGRRTPGYEWGTNPCCVSGVTEILTNKGYVPISDTVGKNTKIWNGESWEEVEPYEAGEADLVRVNLSDGSYLDCTWNHRWVIEDKGFVTTEKLSVGDKLAKFEMPVLDNLDNDPIIDAYSQGFYSGDGNTGLTYSWLYETKYDCEDRLIGSVGEAYKNRKTWKHGPMLDKGFVPVNASLTYKLHWLAGLLDSDGTITKDENGSGFQITSVNKDFLDRVKLMLTTVGVRAKIVKGHDAGYRSMPDGKGGSKDYLCKETHRLLIGNYDAYHLIESGLKLSRVMHDGGKPQRDARRFVRVVSFEPLDYEMTYCYTEPKTSRGTFNGIVTGNSEIILRPNQFCNLSEIVIRPTDDEKSIMRKIRIATILGTFQSTLTHFPYLRKSWKKNTEEERLLGVSMTGIMDNAITNGKSGVDILAAFLEKGRNYAVEVNKELADAIGIEQSASISCVKPSGSVSQLVDAASGIHARHNDFYVRTVRGDNKDPLTQFMIAGGFPAEPCVMKPDTTTVFSFPIKSPDDAVCRTEMSAIDQLNMWLIYQRHWCEHKPSVTITVKEHEWMEVGAFVYKHFDEISGISFLPHSDHIYRQAPYQDCSAEEYEALKSRMPTSIDWVKLAEFEYEDMTKGMQSLACASGDGCELVDI
jgi:ribonucleotide reductase, class II